MTAHDIPAPDTTVLEAADRAILTAFADDEHLMGQRHTEWIGVAPFLEEDLAFASIGQDELGHAAMLYELLADGDADQLALGRSPSEYRSCWLVEAPCTDWADALVRHWLYDEAELLRWRGLAESSSARLRGIAARALREETYHRRHATAFLDSLAGDSASMSRLQHAFAELMPLGAALFDTPAGGAAADPSITGPPLESLAAGWAAAVGNRFGSVGDLAGAATGQRGRTVRSIHFDEMYSRMREVILLDPSAKW